MKVINSIKELKAALDGERENGKNVGFVPTMGALHAGHISLVKRCVAENDVCVVSIFVNPTQFNNKQDLTTYPRTFEADAALLEPNGCQYIFHPTVEEMYPEEDTREFDFGALGTVMEGEHRPGHFNGVAQIVSKLFDAVEPDNSYFGEKDFQQIAIIRSMAEQCGYTHTINACPILREDDGLALSSRNVRLTADQRQKAPQIAQRLKESTTFVVEKSIEEVQAYVTDNLNAVDCLEVEYFTLVDSRTLQPIKSWDEAAEIVGCIAVFCGDVRLIDNIRYK